MSALHDFLLVTSDQFYVSDVYLGEFSPPNGQDTRYSITSLWTVSPTAGNMSIRLEIWSGGNKVTSQTFSEAKVTAGTPPCQYFRLDGEFYLPLNCSAKFYCHSSDANDNASRQVGIYVVDPASTADLYHADINVAVDSGNNRDEYTVTWFKNGARVTSGIGAPDITVIDRASGDPLFDDDLTEISGTGILKKDVTGTLISPGNAYVAIASATIDSATRTFSKVIGRDAVV